MGKYTPLRAFLAAQDRDDVPMSFAEIERILDFPLPQSKRYPAWWSNNPSNNPMTREWLAAGFETASVNPAGEKLVFRRVATRVGPNAMQAETEHGDRHPGFGFMKGQIWIAEDFDVTGPFDEGEWAEALER